METPIYTIIQETEKAIKVRYPYWEKTSEYKKKHIQKWVSQWVPKAITADKMEGWIQNKMKEMGFNMNFIGMGMAPIKKEVEPLIMPDEEKIKAHYKVFYDKVYELTGQKPHHRSGFEGDGAYFIVDGKEYDFEQEYNDLKLYKPVITTKRYK